MIHTAIQLSVIVVKWLTIYVGLIGAGGGYESCKSSSAKVVKVQQGSNGHITVCGMFL